MLRVIPLETNAFTLPPLPPPPPPNPACRYMWKVTSFACVVKRTTSLRNVLMSGVA